LDKVNSTDNIITYNNQTKNNEAQIVENRSNNIVQIIKRLKEESIQTRKRSNQQFDTFERAYIGDHYPNLSYSPYTKWKSRQTINYVGDSIDIVTSYLLEQSLRPVADPPSEEQQSFTFAIQEVIDNVWKDNQMYSTGLEDYIKSGLNYGEGWKKIWFDPTLDEGKGEIVIDDVDPRDLYFDGTCNGQLKKARHIIYEKWIPFEEALRRFPKAMNAIRRATSIQVDQNIDKEEVAHQSMFSFDGKKTWDIALVSPAQDANQFKQEGLQIPVKYPNKVKLVEAWLRDMSEEEYTDKNGKKQRRAAYTNNLRLVTLIDDTVVQDVSSPYIYLKFFPFIPFYDRKIPGKSWGTGTTSQIWPLNMDVNKKDSFILDFIKFAGNPVWVIDKDANVKKGDVSNIPGLVINPEGSGKRVERLSPPQMPTGFFESKKESVEAIRDLSGVRDAMLGRGQKGTRSGQQAEVQNDPGQGKLRAKVNALKDSIVLMGEVILALIRQYYTEERIVKVAGEYHKPVFVPFSALLIDGTWRIKVEAMPSTQSTRAARFDQAMRLFGMHIIDGQAVLDIIDFPNKDKIQKRMEQYNNQYLQAMAQRKTKGTKAPTR
jgi:hypothetical protein